MTLRDLMDQEAAKAETLATRASLLGEGVVSPVLIAASRLAVLAVAKDDGGGVIGEPVADLMALRANPKLRKAIEQTIATARDSALQEITGALRQGFEDDAKGRALLLEADSALSVVVDLTAAEISAMDDFPILGHTALEMATYLAGLLRHAIAGAIAGPLTGRIDAKGLPGALGEVGRLHGVRLANAVREAYQAGTSAAARALADALTQPFLIPSHA